MVSDFDDRRLYPIYEKCRERRMILEPQTSTPWGGKSIEIAHPTRIDRVAEDFPDLTILLGHACYPYIREAMMVAARGRVLDAADQGGSIAQDSLQERVARIRARRRSDIQTNVPGLR